MHALLLAATVVAAAGSMGAAHGEKQEAQRAVQREFRYYRITVYNTFRTRRSEYDARRAAGDAAFQAWLAAGRPIGQAEALSQWFRHAKAVSSAAQLAALPPLPVFVAEVAPRLAPQHDITPQLTTSPAPPAIDKPMQLRAEDDLVVSAPSLAPPAAPQQPDKKPSGKSTWQSLQRALIRGVVYGTQQPALRP